MINSAQTKEWGILLFVLAADLAGLFLLKVIGFGFWNNWPVTGILLAILLVLSAVTALALSLIHSRVTRIVFMLALLVIIVAVGQFKVNAMVGAVIFLVSMAGAARVISDEIDNRIEFGVRVVYRAGVRLLVIGFVIVGLSYLFPLIVTYINTNEALVKAEEVDPFIKPVEPLLTQVMPSYKAEQNVDDLIDARLAEEEKKLPAGMTLPSNARDLVKAELAKSTGTTLTGKETMSTIVAGIINKYIGPTTHEYPHFFAGLVIFLLYITVYPFVSLLAWPTLAVIAVLLALLRSARVVEIKTDSIQVQRLTLS